jgi:hypothetical protein
MARRIGSSRRLVASTLAVTFFIAYALCGVFILANRAAADPDRLQLWLSGGMVIYLIYHTVRCVWSQQTSDLELTDAEKLWLGGAPLQRSSVVVYHVGTLVVESFLKTLLLMVVLARDVHRIELLAVGVFTSLVMLQVLRICIKRWFGGLAAASSRMARVLATAVAMAVVAQVLARLVAVVPFGSPTPRYIGSLFTQLGETAASNTVHWLAIPWWPASRLIVAQRYDMVTCFSLACSLAMIPLAIAALVRVDSWARIKALHLERDRFRRRQYRTAETMRSDWRTSGAGYRSASTAATHSIPTWIQTAAALMSRQAVTIRRYRATILFTFLIPTLLCLSPLATGQVARQWMLVVGGTALCTILLAPSALRIDFRRDLRRMMLLRGMPVRPLSMVIGQIGYPVLITLLFQGITLAVAAAVTRPGWGQVLMWSGLLSALAVFTFACENALFLAYPHHEHSQGIAMLIRAKLTFLGKFTVILASVTGLVIWASVCHRWLPPSLSPVAVITGSIAGTWLIATAALAVTISCWQRFDLAHDVPPQ